MQMCSMMRFLKNIFENKSRSFIIGCLLSSSLYSSVEKHNITYFSWSLVILKKLENIFTLIGKNLICYRQPEFWNPRKLGSRKPLFMDGNKLKMANAELTVSDCVLIDKC